MTDPALPTKTSELQSLAQTVLVTNYRQAPVVVSHGRGAELWDIEGRRYLDLWAGIAVSSVGHGHPHLAKAIAEQAAKVIHSSNLIYNEPSIRLAARLTQYSGKGADGKPNLPRAYFCNSGTEAIEACLKLARRAAFVKGKTSKTRFIAFDNAFHGRTLGALALTGTPKYWEGFGADHESVNHVPYGDIEAVKAALAAHPDQFAGIVVEPVQGEGGVTPAPKGFLKALRQLADEHDALLVIDEVQTGVCRTGKFFGYQNDDVIPDAIAMAKGLGGGVPIGAMLIAEKHNHVFAPGTHGCTFGGNPLATAAALAVLDIIENEKILEHVQKVGAYLGERLDQIVADFPKAYTQARGVGLMRGLALQEGFLARDVIGTLREVGVLASVAGDTVVRLIPPLVITRAQIDEAVDGIAVASKKLLA